MKTSIKLLFALLCVLILSACSNPIGQTDKQPEVVIQEQGKIYSCNDLQSDKLRVECENQMNIIVIDVLYSEILNTFDIARCAELPESLENDCIDSIKISGITGPISDEEVEIFQKATSLGKIFPVAEGEEGQDKPLTCTDLKTSGYKEYCEKVLTQNKQSEMLTEIIIAANPSRCDELTDVNLKRECKAIFGIEEGPQGEPEDEFIPDESGDTTDEDVVEPE